MSGIKAPEKPRVALPERRRFLGIVPAQGQRVELGKGQTGEIGGPRTLRESPIRPVQVEPLRSEEEIIRDLEARGEKGDLVAKRLAQHLKATDTKTRQAILNTPDFEKLYEAGFRQQNLERRSDSDFSKIVSDLESPQRFSLFQHTINIGRTIIKLREINKLIGSVIPERQIESLSIEARFLPRVLSLTKIYYLDQRVLGLIGDTIKEIVRYSPEETKTILEKELRASRPDSLSEVKKCGIAIGALASHENGFDTLLSIYCDTRPSWIKKFVNLILSKVGYNIGGVDVHYQIRGLLFKLIGQSSDKDILALKFLRALAFFGMIKEPTANIMSVYQLILDSQKKEIKDVAERASKYLSCFEDELFSRGHLFVFDDVRLEALEKAILTDYGLELSKSSNYKNAAKALLKALDFGILGRTIPDIRYALAFNYYGLGDKKNGLEQLKKAVDLDDYALTTLLGILDRVPPTIESNTWTDLGDYFAKVNIGKKAAILFALGHIIVDKESMGLNRAKIVLEILTHEVNKTIWQRLEDHLNDGKPGEFKKILNDILNIIKSEEKKASEKQAEAGEGANIPTETFTSIVIAAANKVEKNLPAKPKTELPD